MLIWHGHRVDLLELELVRRLGIAIETLREGMGTDIESVCKQLRSFFDFLLGPGAGGELLPQDNLREALALYADFIKFGKRQGEAVQEWAAELLAEYDPALLEPSP